MAPRDRKLLLLYILLGPGLLVGSIAGNELYGYLRVERELALCCEVGMTLDWEALYGPPVPEHENAAPLIIEAYETWDALHDSASPSQETDWLLLLMAGFPVDNLVRSDVMLPAADRVLDYYAPVLELLDRAAELPACRIEPVDSETLLSSPVRRTIGRWNATQLLGHRAVRERYRMGGDAAMRQLARACRLWRHKTGDPTLVTMLIDQGCLGLYVGNAIALLQHVPPESPETCNAMLQALPTRAELTRRYRADICGELSGFAQPLLELQRRHRWRWTRLGDWSHEADITACTRLLWQSLDLSRQEASLQPWPEPRWFYVAVDTTGTHWSGAYDFVSSFTSVHTQFCTNITQLEMLRIALMLRLHHIEHGTYPDSLDTLPWPDGEGVPLDPFDGRPLRYRIEPDGYRLWSVGRNLTDEGGLVENSLGNVDSGEEDIVLWIGPAADEARREEFEMYEEEWRQEMIDDALSPGP